jgi:hypothetical protein
LGYRLLTTKNTTMDVYNVGQQGTDLLVQVLNPLTTTTDQALALEYTSSADAASVANYLNGLHNGNSYVIVGPHPKPHH